MDADYPLLNSWMIGRDVNVPDPFPSRIVGCEGGFAHALEAALFPAVISNEGPAFGDITQILQHFVAFVLVTRGLPRTLSSSSYGLACTYSLLGHISCYYITRTAIA